MKSVSYKLKVLLIFLMVIVFNFMNIAEAKGVGDIILNLSGTEENSLHIFNSEDGMWFPGKTVEKSFTIKNKTGYRCSINNMKLQMKSVEVSGKKLDNTEVFNSQRIDKFNQAMKCTIKYNSGFNKKVIFDGDFKSFANGGKNIDIEEIVILNNEEKNFSINVTMDEAADNSTQGIKAEFDIIFNFYSTDNNNNNNSGGPYMIPGTNSNEKPVITLIGDKEVDVEWGQNYVDAGATALDKEDGDITDKIIVKVNGDQDKIDTSKSGTYVITYNVTDSNGNKADQVIRIVNVKDKIVPPVIKEKPILKLIGDSKVDVYLNEKYVDAGATAFDKEDGDITKNIIIKVNGKMEKIDTSKLGTNIITYNVSDSDGNKAEEVKRIVVVKERVKEKEKESILEKIGVLPKTGEESPLKWYIIGAVMIVLGILIKKNDIRKNKI